MPRPPLSARIRIAPALAGIVAIALFGACAGDAGSEGPPVAAEPFVVPTLPPGSDVPSEAAVVAGRADVLAAADAAVAAVGGAATRTSVDLMGYVVLVRQDDGTFTTVQLDVGFGVVFVEPAEVGRRADELSDQIDLRRAVDAASEAALREEIGAAADGIVVGAELEPDEYDIDIQYPDGRVLEVRLDDATFTPTSTRIRGG